MPCAHARHVEVRPRKAADLAYSQPSNRLSAKIETMQVMWLRIVRMWLTNLMTESNLFNRGSGGEGGVRGFDWTKPCALSKAVCDRSQVPRVSKESGAPLAPPHGSILTTVSTTWRDPAPNKLATTHDPQARYVPQTICR